MFFNRIIRQQMSSTEHISCIFVLYFQPVIFTFGILFNGITIFIFLTINNPKYYRKTSLIQYLLALSICNIFQLILSIFVIFMPAFEQFIDDERFPNEYKYLVDLNSKTVRFAYPLLMAANYASIWILSLICAQRYQAICHPGNNWKKRLHFTRNSKLCIVLCIVFAFTVNFIRFWELQPLNSSSENITDSILRNSLWYKIVQEGFIYGFIVYFIPIICLIWLNFNTFQIIRSGQHNRPDAEHRTALMTFSVFILFVLLTSMPVSLRILMILFGNFFTLNFEYMWLVDLSNLLMNANALVMPLICFVFTRGFRDLFFVVRFQPTSYIIEDPNIKSEQKHIYL